MLPYERSLVKRLAGKPFALIGVNSDKDKKFLASQLEKEPVTWRSFWNGPEGPGGPIAARWNVQSWPTVYLIDASGTIRYKVSGSDEAGIDKMIATLIAEAETRAK